LKNFYLREQLIVVLRYSLSLTFYGIMKDVDYSLTVCLGPLFAQPLLQIDHHLDELPAGED